MVDRERKVSIDGLSEEQVDHLSVQIGDKVRGIVDEAVTKVNAILKVYGMSSKMAIQFEQLGDSSQEKLETPENRENKIINDNLKKEETLKA